MSEEIKRLKSIWRGMINRCENPKATGYENYGGRGIIVCKEWHEFESFYNWAISNKYAHNLSIDRIDNNGNYEPDNCKWSTSKEQASNRRTEKLKCNKGRPTGVTGFKKKNRRIKLKQFRIGLQLNQQEMADKIGISKGMYISIENGNRNGSYEVWTNIQKAFNIPDEQMWGLQNFD